MVTLTSSDPGAASVPPTVTVPAGQMFQRSTITTSPVPVETTVVLTASWAGTAVTGTRIVRP